VDTLYDDKIDQAQTVSFEEQYLAIRQKEKRIYSDQETARLPEISPSHIYYKEWIARKDSSGRLISYLTNKNKPLNILEIGCGNGWLSSKLAGIQDARVTGLDINRIEIEQAKRVFKSDNLEFIYNKFSTGLFESPRFDCIVFAASIQYFPSFRSIINDCLLLLDTTGEIHIIDTHFYNQGSLGKASDRTKKYYSSIGFPAMSANYHYHTFNDLRSFKYKVLFNPRSIINKLFNTSNPFYWITISG